MKKAQRILNELIQDLRNKQFKYESKEEKEIDWSAYNLSKIHEIHFFLIFVKEAVDGLQVQIQKQTGPGRPLSDVFDLAKIILVKEYFQTGERQAEGLGLLFKEKLDLKAVPSASTIGRAYSRSDVQEILGKVFEMTSDPIKNETSFSADGTGIPLSIKQNYENDREKHEKHAGYDKAAVMISNNYHIATAVINTKGTASDMQLFPPLLEHTVEKFHHINDIELDAGILSRENCQLIANAGATPYIFPKKGITLNQNGSSAWKKMLLSLIKDPQAWLRFYHNRSQSECYFSSHKRRFARPILKKIEYRRGVQSLTRIAITNITMLITAYCEHRVEVKQFEQAYF